MKTNKLKDCVQFLDEKRIPLSSTQRKKLKKVYRYYGAQGIIDYVDNYIFDGDYILVAEDGNNLKSLNMPIATWVTGKFWVNNHAHILGRKNGYNLKYIYYLLNFLDLRGFVTGSAQPKLNQENLSNISLSLPNIDIQNKVVSLLSVLDSKIEINNAISQQLESMSKTIYDYWFLQFEFPNEEGKPYKSSGGKMVWNEELQQEIPVGWTSAKLKDIIIENPKSKIKVSDVKNDGEIPFFTSGTDILSTNESIVSGLNCYLNTGGNADVKYYYGEASYSTDTWCITAENETKYILPFVLNKIKPSMDKVFFQGTGLRHLQKNLLREYQFYLPDSNVVKEFSKLASDIFKKQHNLLKENKKLESLKQFLLPLLMNGQVTINEK